MHARGLRSQPRFNPHSPLLANEFRKLLVRRFLSASFNPHSPLLANELRMLCSAMLAPNEVSIHIRHCWRMNCWNCGRSWQAGHVSIHIRHCWRMNFVSPVISAITRCFNPHSPLLANELALGWDDAVGTPVSIHIRHCWRMNCVGIRCGAHSERFQSTFAIAGE